MKLKRYNLKDPSHKKDLRQQNTAWNWQYQTEDGENGKEASYKEAS